eukprot:1157483-Pelagomonas_calceolata.AAC.4
MVQLGSVTLPSWPMLSEMSCAHTHGMTTKSDFEGARACTLWLLVPVQGGGCCSRQCFSLSVNFQA